MSERPYDAYARKMGVSPGVAVPVEQSIRALVADKVAAEMVAAAGAGESFTLDPQSLMHVVNVLAPHIQVAARKVGVPYCPAPAEPPPEPEKVY